MKKYLAVFVAIFVLAFAGSVLAAGHDVVIIFPTPGAPAVDITSPTVQQAIQQQLAEIGVPESTTISVFDSTSGTRMQLTALTPEQRANVPSGQVAAAVLGQYTVNESKIYTIGVTLSNLEVGDNIEMQMNESSAGGISASLLAGASDKYTFRDDDGHVITKVPANKHVNIAMYMEKGKTYSPLITTSIYNVFSITASRTDRVIVINQSDSTITITPQNASGTVSYTSSVNWVTVNSSGIVTIHPTERSLLGTTQTVTITATDSSGSKASVTLSIRISAAGSGDIPAFTLYSDIVSAYIRLGDKSTEDRTAELYPTNAQGTVTYKATVSPSEGLIVTFN